MNQELEVSLSLVQMKELVANMKEHIVLPQVVATKAEAKAMRKNDRLLLGRKGHKWKVGDEYFSVGMQ